MHTTLAPQLANSSSAIFRRHDGTASTELPDSEAVEQMLAAVWSDLFQLFPGTALAGDAEEIAWDIVNLFHRATAKRSAQVDRATDEIRCLVGANDGSEGHASGLEEQVAAQGAEAATDGEAMLGLEALRETAAAVYLHETGSSWHPAGGSRLCRSSKLTSAVVDGREFLRARAERRPKWAMPEASPVVFAGGRLSLPTNGEAKTFASNGLGDARPSATMSPTWCWRAAATARASTGLPPPGPSSARCRRLRSGSTAASDSARVTPQRADARAQSALSRRLGRQRCRRVPRDPGEAEAHRCCRSARAAPE